MRFVVFGILLAGWSALWWWTYVFHIKGCGFVVAQDVSGTAEMSDGYAPLTFRWSDTEPIPGFGFVPWRDSIVHALGEEDVLYITGIAFRDEEGPLTKEELGLFRARKIAGLFTDLDPYRILIGTGTGEITADIRNKRFAGFRMRTLKRNASVFEMPDRALIYFPYDSLTAESIPEIDLLLLRFSQRALITGKSIGLMPVGDVQDTVLAQWRIDKLQSKLLETGFPRESISVLREMSEEHEESMFPSEADIVDRIALFIK